MMKSPSRLRSKKYLNHIRGQTCLLATMQLCNVPGEAHHLTHAQPRAMSLKTGDQFTVPLCHRHHMELHAAGNEARWWALWGIDPIAWAEKEYSEWQEQERDSSDD